MITLRNNTKSTSKVGYIVALDPRDSGAFVYVTANATKAVGVITESVAYRKPCKIATLGDTANVFVVGNVVKGDIIRTVKTNDRVSFGACTIVRTGDAPYLRVGEALNSGSGLISVVIDFQYAGSDTGVGYVPYTGATDDVDIGGYDISAGSGSFGSATDYVDIDDSGNMYFLGDATVWDDLRIVPSIFDVPGGTDPDVNDYQPAGSGTTFKVYAFAKGDSGYFTIQLPHSYKEGTSLYPHVHWTPGARGVAESGNVVQWRLDYSFADIDGTFPASTTVPLPDTCDGTDHKHQMTPMGTISGVGLGISSQMFGRIYRWNDASDTWVGTLTNLPIFLEFDIHFEIDSVGSKTIHVK